MQSKVAPKSFQLRRTLRRGDKEPPALLTKIAWSPSGKALAAGSIDHSVWLWDACGDEPARVLNGHKKVVTAVAWSCDGEYLASASDDLSIRVWDVKGTKRPRVLRGHTANVTSVAWLPNSKNKVLASGSDDGTVRVWRPFDERPPLVIRGHSREVLSVAWSPDGKALASASFDGLVKLWDPSDGRLRRVLAGHDGQVYCVAWSPLGGIIATCSSDMTVRIWNVETGKNSQLAKEANCLEGHTNCVLCVSFSQSGRLLASRALDDSVRLWRCYQWETIEVLQEPGNWPYSGVAFHPTERDVLAALSLNDREVQIWQLDLDMLKSNTPRDKSVRYRNAKVILAGDTGVGKTALRRALIGKKYSPTDSSAGPNIWPLYSYQERKNKERREILLWDLAGQPGYRVTNQLHLNDAAVSVIVFDAHSAVNPLAGVFYWARAVDRATRNNASDKMLVAARADRGLPSVSKKRINGVCKLLSFKKYFETSSKQDKGIKELGEEIRQRINWEQLPIITTPQIFYDLKRFIVEERGRGHVLSQRNTILKRYAEKNDITGKATQEALKTCLSRLEMAGIVKHLPFNLVLLQPDLLDYYCAAIALAAGRQADGLGYIEKSRVLDGHFTMDPEHRVPRDNERLMLLAAVEEVVGRGIAFEVNQMLVFPSEVRVDMPEQSGSYVKTMIFRFEGPVQEIYAVLAVSIIHSPDFSKDTLFKNAAVFRYKDGRLCGFSVGYPDVYNDALGELTVFFGVNTNQEARGAFLSYVSHQLDNLALKDSVTAERVYQCSNPICLNTIAPVNVAWCRERGQDFVWCRCGNKIELDQTAEGDLQTDSKVLLQVRLSEEERERQQLLTTLDERKQRGEYDVFLCHNSKDKPQVRELAERLDEQGILPWLDERELVAGDLFIKELERVIQRIPTAAVIVGPNWIGSGWREQEYFAILQLYVESRGAEEVKARAIIPVLLPGSPEPPALPVFLRGFGHIDFRKTGINDPGQLRRLVLAIRSTKRFIEQA